MNKILAILILGISLTGAILMISIAQFFEPPTGYILKITIVATTVVFVIFTVYALVFRKRLDETKK